MPADRKFFSGVSMRWRRPSISLTLLLATSGCFNGFPFRRELREDKHISNFALDGDRAYFGAGYHLYRLSLSPSPSVEQVFTTDRILVEQPVVAEGVAYFGGSMYVDSKRDYGEHEGFLAVDLQSREVRWKFPLGVGGYDLRTTRLSPTAASSCAPGRPSLS